MARIRDFFVYEADFNALAAAASANNNINVQADSDFLLQKITYQADIAGGAQTSSTVVIPLCTIQITDGGSGRSLFALPAPIPNIFGTGQIPFILPTPKVFAAKSTITVILANYSNATTYNIRLSFIGAKLFNGTNAPTVIS